MNPIRVGLVGASPVRGWAASAHIPALLALPQFTLAAVATTRQQSADAVAQKFGIPLAFGDARSMIARPDIDLVIVTVKVPAHRELVLAALAAGKHVFCEWPLGLNSAEAEEMLVAARRAGVVHMVGLQGRAHPALIRVRELVEQGHVGKLLSCTLVSSLASWGPSLPASEAYRADRSNGATGLTIPGGHSLDSLAFCVGPWREISAVVTTQHTETEIIGTGKTVKVSSPDQVRLEINGTEGDLLVRSVTAVGRDPVGIQRAELVLSGARRGSREYADIAVPREYSVEPDGMPGGPPFYTAQLLVRLANAVWHGVAVGPDFAGALECHRMLDAIQAASDGGRRVTL